MPTIPVTGVGKIFKPDLRTLAARRMVETLLRDDHAIPDATIAATPGGKRGMRITISLPAASVSVSVMRFLTS